MTKRPYHKPQMGVFRYCPETTQHGSGDLHLSLSYKEILGLVEDAFAEIRGDLPTKIEIKRQVLDHLSENNLALALYAAIVGASKVANPIRNINCMEGATLGKFAESEGSSSLRCAC